MIHKNWLEWSVFALSGVVVLLIAGFLAYNAATSDGDPIDINVQIGVPEGQDGSFLLPMKFENRGGQSVEDVQVDVALIQDGAEAETASITVPYLPRQSTREGWVVFSIDPDDADEVQVQVVSYIIP